MMSKRKPLAGLFVAVRVLVFWSVAAVGVILCCAISQQAILCEAFIICASVRVIPIIAVLHCYHVSFLRLMSILYR